MSSATFSGSYKLFEPEVHVERPFIVGVDERLDSPETATLKYEEAIARANGGDVRGATPPGLISMATYAKAQPTAVHGMLGAGAKEFQLSQKTRSGWLTRMTLGFDATRGFQDSPYSHPYSTQTYPSQAAQTASQLSQDSFDSTAAAVGAVDQYVSVLAVLSCQPAAGSCNTKVQIRVSMSTTVTFFSVFFGSQKVQAQIDGQVPDGSEIVYTLSCLVPQHMSTECHTPNVPMSLVIEGPTGEEISRADLGQFMYRDVQVGSAGGRQDDITRKLSKSPGQVQTESPPKSPIQLRHDSTATTNTYDYPGISQQPTQSPYATAFPQPGNNAMISTYRASTTFTDQYSRVPPPALRTPTGGWPAYSTHLDTNRSPAIHHTAMTRPSLMPLSQGSMPQLIRTSTLQAGAHGNGQGYNPYALYPNKAVLEIHGKLDSMADGWTAEEWANRRRVVLFKKSQNGSTLSTTFRPVGPNEKPANSTCISCIWWEEKGEHFVTSVDTIYLLEQLVAAPSRFTVEEKNRIRRNLEGFRPLTVSKTKPDSEEFFKVIMGFPHPKPRNIEKDVKVFRWKLLEPALKKIISKYSASPSSMVPSTHMLTPAPYHPLPTPPLSSGAGGAEASSAYTIQAPSHHDTLASPRSLSGSSSTWGQYTSTHAPLQTVAGTRTLSPTARTTSPQSSLRLSSLPSVSSYDTRAMTAGAYATNLHSSVGHAHAAAVGTTSRWDGTPSTYAESYPSLSTQHGQAHHQIYSNSHYDGTQRS
ncbi:hypothetical protein jhhlp_007829 [Lomentospora prolificans]|uniref:DUF7082 domain-containing protein n=1 Tax=Lomentospora prolificans TaxID=41688 RepID=A0A2N3N0P3_9PEZI|nr:hypothetical protein jhhlp_007829 [Lomentospora prolificans]